MAASFPIEDFSHLEAELYAQGFRNQSPSIEAFTIDSEAAKGPCPKCGRPLTFVPMLKMNGARTYRCFAWCRKCDLAVEF